MIQNQNNPYQQICKPRVQVYSIPDHKTLTFSLQNLPVHPLMELTSAQSNSNRSSLCPQTYFSDSEPRFIPTKRIRHTMETHTQIESDHGCISALARDFTHNRNSSPRSESKITKSAFSARADMVGAQNFAYFWPNDEFTTAGVSNTLEIPSLSGDMNKNSWLDAFMPFKTPTNPYYRLSSLNYQAQRQELEHQQSQYSLQEKILYYLHEQHHELGNEIQQQNMYLNFSHQILTQELFHSMAGKNIEFESKIYEPALTPNQSIIKLAHYCDNLGEVKILEEPSIVKQETSIDLLQEKQDKPKGVISNPKPKARRQASRQRKMKPVQIIIEKLLSC